MKRIIILLLLLVVVPVGRAQLFDAAMGHVEALAAVIGKERAFSATLIMERELAGKRVIVAEGPFAVRDGKLRMELTVAKLPRVDDESLKKLEKDGLVKSVTILLPASKKAILLVPARKACIEAQLASDETKPGEPRFESKTTGIEIVDKRSCLMKRVTVINSEDVRSQITVWEDTDRDRLIIQSKMDNGDGTDSVLRFTNVDMTKPADNLFTAPTDYRKLGDKDASAIAQKLSEFDLERDALVSEVLR